MDEIMIEDLESASEFYDALVKKELPHQTALRHAKDYYGVDLDDKILNKILSRFACTLSSMEECVKYYLKKGDFS